MLSWLRSLVLGIPDPSPSASRPDSTASSPAAPAGAASLGSRFDPSRRIVRVWVEEGCLVCGACAVTCPEVFAMADTTAVVRADADLAAVDREAIELACEGCCVEVIKLAYA